VRSGRRHSYRIVLGKKKTIQMLAITQ